MKAVTEAIAQEAKSAPASAAAPEFEAMSTGNSLPPDAPAQAGEAHPPATPAPASIEDVDAQVASQAEAEIAKEDAHAAKLDGAMSSPQPAAATDTDIPAPEAVVEAKVESAPEAAAKPESKPESKPETKPEPKVEVRPEPRAGPGAEQKERVGADAAGRDAAKPAAAPKPKVPGFFKTKVEPALLGVVGLASKPLASKPDLVRAAGLLSVNTLVLGAGLWVYTLYFRPAHAAPEGGATFDFAHSGLPQPSHEPGEKKAGGHGAEAGEGGHESAKPEGHGEAKGEGHGEKKEEGHGGGEGHGSSAKPAEPKKSIIASGETKYVLNEKLSGKPADKAKEKKEGGHGEH